MEIGGSGSRAGERGDYAFARAHHQLLGLKENEEHVHACLELPRCDREVGGGGEGG
jgi:hypothetical protein